MNFLLTALLFFGLNNYIFAEFDNLGRLIDYPGKIEVSCPAQNSSVGVVLVIGQSNSGNHGQKKFMSHYPTKVYNFYNGKCYMAASPLLGTTGVNGEFMTPFADYLIDFGVYKQVIIVPSGMNGTKISFWQKEARLNTMLMGVINKLNLKYQLTEIVWHQGESDWLEKTPDEDYKKAFYSLLSTLRTDINNIPFYYAIATRCGDNWIKDNSIAMMQRTFSNEQNKIYLAIDTDSLVETNERIDGYCHFNEIGQLKTAYSYAMAIYLHH